MSARTDEIDRLGPTCRPDGRALMYHRWSLLLFLHWRVPVAALRPLVPEPLTIDTFEGHAFVGLVPFTMSGVRPPWLPPVPGLSAFHETNVRTYVHLAGRDPGVWFFSLEAENLLAVLGARATFKLNYQYARMHLVRAGAQVDYGSRRIWPGRRPADCRLRYTIGAEPTSAAVPGTLEHFLVERYVLYAGSGRKLLRGRVHHRPYPLQSARLDSLDEDLLAANGIVRPGESPHTLYSPGVDVEVFAPELPHLTASRPRD